MVKINNLEQKREKLIIKLHKLDIKYRNSFNKSVISRLHNLTVILDYRQNIIDLTNLYNEELDKIDKEEDKMFKIQNFLIDVYYLIFNK